eukprot:scaffold127198_cov36-Phaeocystis_antarctica.AAC.1
MTVESVGVGRRRACACVTKVNVSADRRLWHRSRCVTTATGREAEPTKPQATFERTSVFYMKTPRSEIKHTRDNAIPGPPSPASALALTCNYTPSPNATRALRRVVAAQPRLAPRA